MRKLRLFHGCLFTVKSWIKWPYKSSFLMSGSSPADSQGEFVCKIACLSNSPVSVSSAPVLAWGDSCCCWWLSICSALPEYGRKAEREHRPHLLHWYLLSLHICEEGGGKGPIPSWCFSTLADTHMCTHTHTGKEWMRRGERERERERESRQMVRAEKKVLFM